MWLPLGSDREGATQSEDETVMLSDRVKVSDVASVISRATGIPLQVPTASVRKWPMACT